MLRLAANEVVPHEHQVGGHNVGELRGGILRYNHSFVLKPVQPGKKGGIEVDFYCAVEKATIAASNGDGDGDGDGDNVEVMKVWPVSFVPRYFGQCLIQFDDDDDDDDGHLNNNSNNLLECLRLEDITSRYQHPNVMDVKIGRQTYDPFAGPEKRARELAKCGYQSELGFRLCGMKVYDPNTGTYQCPPEFRRRDAGIQHVCEGVRQFFNTPTVLLKAVKELQRILQWFYAQEHLRFYASSLLIVYDGARRRDNSGSGSNDDDDDDVQVKMIDFGHVFSLKEIMAMNKEKEEVVAVAEEEQERERRLQDSNYIQGLESFINTLLNNKR